MSLLLDALKKAAKDKEAAKAANAGAAKSGAAETAAEVQFESTAADAHAQTQNPGDDLELTLDETSLSLEGIKPTTNTISDEALQVLIYKTNHEHKRKRRIIWGGAFFASVLVLIASGVYFFNEMQQEVDALERRHRINMQAAQSEPIKAVSARSLPQSAQVVRKPVPEATRADVSGSGKTAMTRSASAPARRTAAAKEITIVRGEKRDPVSSLLSSAWGAYNNADYRRANELYEQVLNREKNNRDALMGMAAIALKNNDNNKASQFYNRMLQLDPRDAVANAAIINMNTASADSLSETRLQQLLRQSPKSAHLHFALGNKYSAKKKWPEAQAEYFSAFEYDSTNADYAFNLAVSLERIGKPAEAARYYSDALALSQNSNVSFSPDAIRKRLEQIQP